MPINDFFVASGDDLSRSNDLLFILSGGFVQYAGLFLDGLGSLLNIDPDILSAF